MVSSDLIADMVTRALAEDVGSGDITAELIPASQMASAQIMTRQDMVLCGQAWVEGVLQRCDPHSQLVWQYAEGASIAAGATLVTITANARALLTAERTALNFLQTLSSVATITARYVEAIHGTRALLLDTRKTIPLWRQAQKYAVTCGGGKNHRLGLFDAFLIKENHILAAGSITNAIQRARALHPDKTIEIEVENQQELAEAVSAKPDIVMLDNYSLIDLQQAVAWVAGRVKLEVSGNITLDTIRGIAETDVDFISVGALTKHIQAIDLSLRIISTQ